jgi:hypothetical protein
MKPDVPDHLLDLIQQISATYQPPPTQRKKRGKPPDFSALSCLLLAVVAVVTKSFCDSELVRLLEADEPLRTALGFSRTPHRTTLLRRLKALRPVAEEQIALCGQHIVKEVAAQEKQTVSAIDGRMYEALGAKWHSADRRQNRIPTGLRNVDTQSYWSKSGYRGWVQGYRLMLQTLVFPEPVPLFAAFRSNSEGEITMAKTALGENRLLVTDVLLGDETFSDAEFRRLYREAKGWVLTSKQLPAKRRSWKCDLLAYRKETIELLFQRVMQAVGIRRCVAKGTEKNAAFILAGVWLYQSCWLQNYRAGRPASVIKERIDSARWRTPT